MADVADTSTPTPIPSEIKKRLDRGRKRRDEQAGIRNLCLEFARGNQYLFLGDQGRLWDQRNIARQQLEPEEYRNRVWQVRNIIYPIVQGKISAATQRIPSYDITPATNDFEDIAGARTAQKTALSGYVSWNVKRVSKQAIYFALVADESFTFPYWEPDIGPYTQVTDQETGAETYQGVGDVRFRVLGRNEVSWEPGVDYEDSAWCAIEYAKPVDVLKKDPDFIGGELKADADSRKITNKRAPADKSNLVVVTEFFERPCPDYPRGRRMVFANEKLIFPLEDYPLQRQGPNDTWEPVDEPLMHRLSYSIDVDNDDDQGLVRHLIDAQRTFNDAINKGLETKNLALLVQMMAPRGSMKTRRTTTPGAIMEYDPMPGGGKPEWANPPSPQILAQLEEIADRAKADAGFIANSNAIPANVEAGKAIQALLEADQLAWADFLGELAQWHSGVMSDALTLVQHYADSPRIIKYRGSAGWESVDDFRGADIRGQTDVRVLPGSLEPRTRESIEQKITMLVQLFPNYFPPEVIMSALESGTAEGLIDDYEKDIARAQMMLRKIKQGPEVLFTEPDRPALPEEQTNPDGTPILDPDTGQTITTVPGWMPRPFDRVGVHMAVFESFMKTAEFDALDVGMKTACQQYYEACLLLKQRQHLRDQAMQTQQAESLGMQNASNPPVKPMPSLPTTGNGKPSS